VSVCLDGNFPTGRGRKSRADSLYHKSTTAIIGNEKMLSIRICAPHGVGDGQHDIASANLNSRKDVAVGEQ